MSIEKLSGAKGFKGISVERGMRIETPEIVCSYHAMCHYYFETLEEFMQAFELHADERLNDIKKYTDVEPVIQVNEVMISEYLGFRRVLYKLSLNLLVI